MKPIRNSADHNDALEQIEKLIIAGKAGSDRYEVLKALVADYESKSIKIDAPTPGDAIRFRLEQLGLKNRDLEPVLGSRSKISEILAGKRQLSLKMVRDLNRNFGIPLEALVAEPQQAPAKEIPDLSKRAAAKLEKLGVGFKKASSSDWLRKVIGTEQSLALLRKTRTHRSNERTDHTALLYWQAGVLRRARERTVKGEFASSKLTKPRMRRLAQLSQYEDGISQANDFLSALGIQLIYLEPLPGTFVDGASMLAQDGTAIVGISARYDRIDNFWFTLLHECSHLMAHIRHLVPGENAFIDDIDFSGGDELEDEADHLAQISLIPESLIEPEYWNEYTATEDIHEIAEDAGVAVSIVAGRWQRDHGDFRRFSKLIERNTVRKQLESLMSN